jgi:hypothetical protein
MHSQRSCGIPSDGKNVVTRQVSEGAQLPPQTAAVPHDGKMTVVEVVDVAVVVVVGSRHVPSRCGFVALNSTAPSFVICGLCRKSTS